MKSMFLYGCVMSKYILTPKPIVSIMNLDTFNKEHGIEHVATIESQRFFKTDSDKFLGTIEDFFEVEEEQEYNVDSIKRFLIKTYDELVIMLSNNETVPWHLSRVSQRDLPLTNVYNHNRCDTNREIELDNYVIDTGSEPLLKNFADSTDRDCNGHGSFCASLIRDSVYGVCKGSNVYGIKVLDCNGSGTTSGVLRGIEYAYNTHVSKSKASKKIVKSIINMSLGGGYSRALNRAVENTLRNNDFYVVAAAGNEDQDCKNTSPASATGVLSVAASDDKDNRAWFSNYGCSDIYAPGVDITGLDHNNNDHTGSGTSFSSPITVGVLNHYINAFPTYNMQQITQVLLDTASKDKIKGNKENTPNLLVFLV